ncbi:hypothetical protein CRYUN_Cryun15aG0042200 [Craigia yunnanensis]
MASVLGFCRPSLTCVISGDEVPSYATSDEGIVEIHSKALNVLKALEAVLGQLRKFLEQPVDAWTDKTQFSLHSASAHQTGVDSDYSQFLKRDPLYDHETHLEPKIPPSGLSLYGQDHGIGVIRSSGVTRASAPIVTQANFLFVFPFSGWAILFELIMSMDTLCFRCHKRCKYHYPMQRTSSVLVDQILHIFVVQMEQFLQYKSGGLPDEITVEIKGTTSQVQMAQQLIQVAIINSVS